MEVHPLELNQLRFADASLLRTASRVIPNTYPVESGCLEWHKAKDKNGYGVTFFANHQWRVHRFVYFAWVDEIPDGMMVLHKCDNPACCLPEHLFIGDAGINRRDCKAKGRMFFTYGEDHYSTKLKEYQVREIIESYQWRTPGRMAKDFAKKFGVSKGAIWRVLRNTSWKHIKL